MTENKKNKVYEKYYNYVSMLNENRGIITKLKELQNILIFFDDMYDEVEKEDLWIVKNILSIAKGITLTNKNSLAISAKELKVCQNLAKKLELKRKESKT